MFAEIMHKDAYRNYRLKLEALLHIPMDASELDIHQLIVAGFSPSNAMALFNMGAISPLGRDVIIPLRILNSRLARGQRLTVSESDRLFQVTHVTVMAEVLFGNKTKAKRWLEKRQDSFSGNCPISMLSTSKGTRAVEELLLKIAEGYAF